MRILKPNAVNVKKSPASHFRETNKQGSGNSSTKADVFKSLAASIDSFLENDLNNHSKKIKKKRVKESDWENDYNNAKPILVKEQVGEAEKECGKEYKNLLHKGINLLSIREHSVQEITTKLSSKSDSLDVVYAVIDELIDNDYLSDERFTEVYVRSRRNRGFGPNKIRNELGIKGIKNSMIDDHLDVHSAIWYDNAQNQYQKKYGDSPINDYNTWTKRARFMQSRGFSMEHIHSSLPPVDSD